MTQRSNQGEALSSWASVPLDSVAKRGSGHTPDKKRAEYWGGSIKWLSLKDSDRLDKVYVADTVERITPAGIANSSAVLHPVGTVVVTRDAGVGKSAILQDAMAVSQHFMAWRCGERLNNLFLYYWLQQQKDELERVASGNTIKTIGLPYFKALEIPLPPVDEQKAIAAALSGADALLDALDGLVAKKSDLRQAAMQQLLTGQTRLPGFGGDWVTQRLGDLFAFHRTANNARADLSEDGEVDYLHYGDVHATSSPILNCSAVVLPRIEAARVRSATRLVDGDLVMVDASEDYDGIGKAIEVTGVGGRMVVAGLHTFLLRASLGRLVDGFKGYLQFIPAVRDALVRLATGISVYGVSKANVKRVEVALPEPNEQAAIATVLAGMDAEVAALDQRRAKTRMLKQGMMQELLTGRTRLV